MIIRAPQPQDIEVMIGLARMMHKESVYCDFDFDRGKVAAIGAQVLNNPDYFGRVCESETSVIGLMICYVTPYYFGNDLLAQDMILYIDKSRRGSVGAMRMIVEYVEWAKEKGCKEAVLAQTAGIAPDVVAKLYNRVGFELIGQLYKRRLV